MERFVIQKRDWTNGKWNPVKVFLDRLLAEKYMKTKNKQSFRMVID
jgi:hypothetical protein